MGYHMQPFTAADWDYCAGAENFGTGEAPEICHGPTWLFVLGGQQMELHTTSGNVVGFAHTLPYKAAHRLAEIMLSDLEWQNEAAGLVSRWGFTEL